MNWIRYSIGNTRAQNTMPLSIGAPQVHASGVTVSVAAEVGRTPIGHVGGLLASQRLIGRSLN